ncbi:STAS/SEC14 domain-containing protein [Sphingobium nicotianae]|uniref:STAS/SEC14 domain-containing protein n=1 Tax=Sphingobium nicotianae TaxID=2782607 RepID=A0A9X1DG42_9SPHN|nr:STAS/SEC14 domain-containing protein [Sphingobium nicotianae]MBT2189259.1 STAS/SEC14 domain-containing protein [Sphingobium nicotianae]
MAKFKVTYDAMNKLLELKLEGYWSMDDFRDYEAEMTAKHVQIIKQTRYYRVLSDARDFAVQSKEVGQAFESLFDPRRGEDFGRFAILVSSALNAIQAKHVSPHANVAVFTNEKEARTWLLEKGSLPG